MKFSLLVTAIFISSQLFAQTFTTSEPINVATGLGNYHPQIEMCGDGLPGVIWTNSSDMNLYFAKHNGMDAFNTAIKLNPGTQQVQTYNWSGPDLAIEGDNIYVVYHDSPFTTGNIYLVKSTDNGVSFGDTVRVDDLTVGYGQFPDVAVFQDTVWVTYMKFDGAGLDPQYVVSRSIDGGATFEAEVDAGVLWTGEACDCCQPEIIVDGSRVIVFFRNNNSNIRDIKAVVSNDRGATFTDMFSVDNHNWLINACPSTGPDARFMGADKILATYRSSVGGTFKVFINEYNLGTDMSDGLVEVSATSGTNAIINYPQLDYKDGVVGVVWEAAGNGIDTWINVSSSGVAGLDPANAMNISDSTGSQQKPDIVIGDGVFHIVYMDSEGGNNVKYVQANFTVDVVELKNDLVTNAYPLPSKDIVTIQFMNQNQSQFTIELFDMSGKLVMTDKGSSGEYVLKKAGLQNGIYTYTIMVENTIGTGRIIFE